MGVEFRIASKPEDVGIQTKLKSNQIAAYFSRGVIFIKDKTHYRSEDLDFICLHELGHAVVHFFLEDAVNAKIHEIKANAIALGLAATLNIAVSDRMLKQCVLVTKAKASKFKVLKVAGIRRWIQLASDKKN